MAVFLLIVGIVIPAIGVAGWGMASELDGGGASFGLSCIAVGIACLILDFAVFLPRHWNSEMQQAMKSLQSQNYPPIEEVSMKPYISVTFAGCGEKFDIDTFSGRWMPYTQSRGDGLLQGDGTKIPLSPYYIRTQFGCGLAGVAS